MNKSNNKGEKKRKFGEWFFKRQKKEIEKLIDKMDIKAEEYLSGSNVCITDALCKDCGIVCSLHDNDGNCPTPPKALREEELNEKLVCLACKHEICPSCKLGCHNVDCEDSVSPIKICYDNLIGNQEKTTPRYSQNELDFLLKQDRERIKERVLKGEMRSMEATYGDDRNGKYFHIDDILQILDEEQL